MTLIIKKWRHIEMINQSQTTQTRSLLSSFYDSHVTVADDQSCLDVAVVAGMAVVVDKTVVAAEDKTAAELAQEFSALLRVKVAQLQNVQ